MKLSVVEGELRIDLRYTKVNISLNECSLNWDKHKNIVREKDRPKGIGERDILGKPPYFMLWDNERTMIECDSKPTLLDFIFMNKKNKDEKLFLAIQKMLAESNYTTFDLSQ